MLYFLIFQQHISFFIVLCNCSDRKHLQHWRQRLPCQSLVIRESSQGGNLCGNPLVFNMHTYFIFSWQSEACLL